MTAHDPYEHAMDRFEALCDAVITDAAESPRQLVLNAGIPKSSGYRALTSLEKAGFLARDVSGDYVRSDAAWQIGLAAWGFGPTPLRRSFWNSKAKLVRFPQSGHRQQTAKRPVLLALRS